MDTKQLEYFISIAESLNFTRSAKEHYITQPAISHQINELEKELGAKLFIRNSHQVILTTAGEAFMRYAKTILDAAEAARSRAQNIIKGHEGYLRISTVPTSNETLTKILLEFNRQYPRVEVNVDIATGREQIIAINKNEYDFYFSFQSLIQASGALNYIVTDEDRFSLFVPNKYAHQIDPTDFSTLSDYIMAAEKRSEGPFLTGQILDMCSSRGLENVNTINCQSFMSVFLLVNAGMAFSIFPTGIVDSISTKNITVFPIQGDDAVVINAVGWNPSNNNSNIGNFLKVLSGIFGKQIKDSAAKLI